MQGRGVQMERLEGERQSRGEKRQKNNIDKGRVQ